MPDILYKNVPALIYFLQQVEEPLAITANDGHLLWVNEAWEKEFEYSVQEYRNEEKPILWTNMTSNKEDLEADQAMAKEMEQKQTRIYHLVKEYVTKSGRKVPVRLTVLRWPVTGDFEFALVHAKLIHTENLKEYNELVDLIRGVANQKVSPAEAVGIAAIRWATEHPKVITFWIIVFTVMIFGRYGVDVLFYILEKL